METDWIDQDFYATLGVKEDATEADIKKAYRGLAQKYHPDKTNGNKELEEEFKKVSEAYEVLSNPTKREEYNRTRLLFANGGTGGGMFGGINLEDLFSGEGSSRGRSSFLDEVFTAAGLNADEIFGGYANKPKRRGTDIESDVTISFVGSYQGVVIPLRMQTETDCVDCDGFGCNTCSWEGRVLEVRTLNTSIPAGVRTGSRIKIKGQGLASSAPGVPPGDLYLKVTVLPHPVYERKDNDLLVTVPVNYVQMVLGGEVAVPVLAEDGNSGEERMIRLRVPPHTPNGKVFRIKGKGFVRGKKHQSGSRGDFLVTLVVEVPEHISEESRRMLLAYEDALNSEKHTPAEPENKDENPVR